jgi:hypothetical protein
MLQEKLPEPRRCFLNTSTTECVLVDIPELHDHEVVALTPEGLLYWSSPTNQSQEAKRIHTETNFIAKRVYRTL